MNLKLLLPLFLSTLLQFLSAFYAFRLMKSANKAWAVLCVAFLVMAVARVQGLWTLIQNPDAFQLGLFTIWSTLAITLLILIGVMGIGGFLKRNKNFETAMDESEFLLDRAQQVARLGSYRMDIATGEWVPSKVLMEIFGIDAGYKTDVDGWANLVHPDQRREMIDYFLKEVVGKRQPFNYDYRIIRKSDGVQRWVHGMGLLDLDDQGTPVTMVGTIQDITERMVGDLELRESEKRFRTIVDNVNDGYVIHDFEGSILDCNENECRMLGYSREELVGNNLRQIRDLNESVLYEERMKTIRQRGKLDFETHHIRKDGKRLLVMISLRVITQEGKGILQSFVRDVTDLENAEKSVRESEQRFKILAESLPQAVFETDGKGILQYANKSSYGMFGYDPDEVLGKLSALDLVVPGEIPRAYENFKRIIGGLPQTHGNEYQGLRKDGTTFPILIYANPKFHGNRVAGTIGLIVDATSAKDAEMERRQLQEQFFQAQKMESIGTLAGGIAHDFNNLLSGILGGLSLMETDESLSPELKNELTEMKSLVLRGSGLTRQLLGYARKGKYEPKPLDLTVVVSKAADLFGRTRKDILIKRDFSGRSANILGDLTQLEQVLMNLFVNAGQAMPNGGTLELGVGKDDYQVEKKGADASSPGPYAVVTVRDTGLGMDSATLERIFEPFFTTKPQGQGTGLGLASVYGIVKNHGGFVKVASELGKGTTFRVYLPVTDRDPEALTDRSQTGLSAKGLLRDEILLVDDEEAILHNCERHFKAAGFTPLTARSGREGLELFRAHKDRIAVVILDMVMPGLTGMETFEEMKKLDPGVKAILMTGYVMEGQAATVLAAGCKGFIEKPFTMEALSAKVKESI